MSLGSFADAKLQQLDASDVEKLVKDVIIHCVQTVDGIADIVAERDAARGCAQPMPPVLLLLPHHLVTFSRSD